MKTILAFLLFPVVAFAKLQGVEWDAAYPVPLEYRLFEQTSADSSRFLTAVPGNITEAEAEFAPGHHTIFVVAVYQAYHTLPVYFSFYVRTRTLQGGDDLGGWETLAVFDEAMPALDPQPEFERRFYRVVDP